VVEIILAAGDGFAVDPPAIHFVEKYNVRVHEELVEPARRNEPAGQNSGTSVRGVTPPSTRPSIASLTLGSPPMPNGSSRNWVTGFSFTTVACVISFPPRYVSATCSSPGPKSATCSSGNEVG
jgi:hypothetical protein